MIIKLFVNYQEYAEIVKILKHINVRGIFINDYNIINVQIMV